MKRLQFLFLFVLCIGLFSACKKDEVEQPVTSSGVAGLYEGKYGLGSGSSVVFFSFNLKPDGVLEELDETGAIIGKGIWTITGKNFYGTSNYLPPATNKFAVKATYDATAKKLTGTWGYGNNDANGGNWHMTKK